LFTVLTKLDPTTQRAEKGLFLDGIVPFGNQDAIILLKDTNGKRAYPVLLHIPSKK
jgi:hypothetical protein